ncbi:MAG: isochorismatase family protein, partial [Terriglobia bacterium]
MKIDDLFNSGDLAGYSAGGHGRRVGFGKKPAVVVVDMINLYVSPRYALGHGENTQAVIEANARLLEAARRKQIPVFFSNVGLRASAAEKGIWGEKVGGAKGITPEADAVIEELRLKEGDVVVTKPKASVFFGTQLASMLYYQGVDTIIVTGVTTSGCVRATVVDGFSYNFRVIVPVECCGDRA